MSQVTQHSTKSNNPKILVSEKISLKNNVPPPLDIIGCPPSDQHLLIQWVFGHLLGPCHNHYWLKIELLVITSSVEI